MDPVSAIATAVQIARAVQAQLALMAQNRTDCADLANRLDGLTRALDACKTNKHFLEINGPLLNRLMEDMKNAQRLIEFVTEASKGGNKRMQLKAFFGAGNDASQLQELNRRITQHVTDLQPGIAAANAQATAEGLDDVKTKLDRTTAMLEALQGLLLAASVTDAVAGPGQARGAAMRPGRQRPQGSYEDEEDGDYGSLPAGAAAGSAGASGGGSPNPRPSSPLGPKIGRAVEVAAHQFVFGAFMAGLALMHPVAAYRAAVLAFSPLLPASVMVAIQAAVLIHARSLMDKSQRQGMGALVGSILARSLVPLQLYATPTLGALAALAGSAFLGDAISSGKDVSDDFHTCLIGVAGGTLVFAASYLASAR